VLNAPGTGDFRIVADLVDAWGYHWAQGFNDSYPSEQWQAGETIVARMAVPAPVGLPPGNYNLHAAFFAPSTGERLTTIDAAGQFAGAVARVGPLRVARARAEHTPDDIAPRTLRPVSFGPIAILGFDPPPLRTRPGETLPFALYWLVSAPPGETYSAEVRLDDRAGATVATLTTGDPVHGTYATNRWQVGEIVTDRYALRLPRDLSPGSYLIHVTIMDSAHTVGEFPAGALDVLGIQRNFTPPAAAHPLDVQFGDKIALVGYDVASTGGAQTLTLHWRALSETDTDYTVYVHLRDTQGNLVAQRDVQPQDGAYPTSLWVAGEYIPDPHPFTVAPGAYTVEVGLYLPDTGEVLGRGALGEMDVP
jgi:hypothetical protein